MSHINMTHLNSLTLSVANNTVFLDCFAVTVKYIGIYIEDTYFFM